MNPTRHLAGIPPINMDPSVGWDIGPGYTFFRLLGSGSYGSVCDAVVTGKKTRVAIKKFENIFKDSVTCRRILREVELLYSLNHPCIVKPIEAFMRQGSDLYLVMEMGQIDLYNLRQYNFLVPKQVKIITYRLLLALSYLHSGAVVHRDIKPANILVNSDCSIRLCDFSLGRSIAGLKSSYFDCGLAFRKDPELSLSPSKTVPDLEEPMDEMEEGNRANTKTVHCKFEVNFSRTEETKAIKSSTSLEAKKKEQRKVLLTQSKVYNPCHERELTGHVATRSYRPPEVILLEKVYTSAVDIWGAGCVFAELLEMVKENQPDLSKRSALFPGLSCFPLSPSLNPTEKVLGMPVSPHDQLSVIMEVFGTPNVNDLSFLNDQRAEDYVKSLPRKGKRDLAHMLPASGDDALDLLQKMLAFNPYYRITAKEALSHKYFDEVRDKTMEIELEKPVILMTDTVKSEVSMQMMVNEVLSAVLKTK